MKLLLTVQGEGRGHMTQALAVQQWCRRHGHQVVGVLAGAHRNRSWPDFFERGFATPVTRLTSPGFVYRAGRRVTDHVRSITHQPPRSFAVFARDHADAFRTV